MTTKRLQSTSEQDVNLMSDAGHPDSAMVSFQGEECHGKDMRFNCVKPSRTPDSEQISKPYDALRVNRRGREP